MNLKELFRYFYKSPSQFTRKQWIVIAIWIVLNILTTIMYYKAGASFGLALVNGLYGIAIIFGYFTRLLAFATSPFIWLVLYVFNFFKNPENKVVYEWSDAIWFATIAATVIRGYFIEAYTIPTGSMEKSLLIGDFLFVSKMSYGSRMPLTTITFPFAHNKLPFTDNKVNSYLQWMEMPYYRFPEFSKIKNNDVVVFNYPKKEREEDGQPVDKRDNYIKRCVGIPGDSLNVTGGTVFVNGRELPFDKRGMISYLVTAKYPLSIKKLREIGLRAFDIRPNRMEEDLNFALNNGADCYPIDMNFRMYKMHLTAEMFEKMKTMDGVEHITPNWGESSHVDPCYPMHYAPELNWDRDNYGSIYIPKRGDNIRLDSFTYAVYKRVINLYENNPSFKRKEGKYFLNGKEITDYTFKYDYYFMMGDNRHNSDDSRFWGFVPETHVVGKALFVWMSWDSFADKWYRKIRWNRLFRGIH